METESQQKEKFIEIFEKNGCIISVTCNDVGIEDRQVLRDWMKSDKEFRHTIMKIILEKTDYAEELELELIFQKRNTRAIMHYLDRHHPDYKPVRRVYRRRVVRRPKWRSGCRIL